MDWLGCAVSTYFCSKVLTVPKTPRCLRPIAVEHFPLLFKGKENLKINRSAPNYY